MPKYKEEDMRDHFMMAGNSDSTAFKITRFTHSTHKDAEEYIRIQPMYCKASAPDEWLPAAGGISISLDRLDSLQRALDSIDRLYTQQFTKGAGLKSNNPEVPLPKGERKPEPKLEAPKREPKPKKAPPAVEEW